MKSCNWQSPLVVRRFKSPVGPLGEVDSGMVYDFSKQREIMPHPIGARFHEQHTMNSGGGSAHAHVTTPDTHGTGSPFPFPK
jgi:hypothetical protein